MDDILQQIKELYKSYIDDDKYVYKLCGEYIVILEKLPYSLTNEQRKNIVDPMYAKYRASCLKCILIFNRLKPESTINQISNTFNRSHLEYVTGSTIYPDSFDEELDNICSHGCHYFKSIDVAFYYGEQCNEWDLKWHDNGKLRYKGKRDDKRESGLWIYWYENGYVQVECEYTLGQRHGYYKQWYDNGQIEKDGGYTYGMETGQWTFWYSNGDKKQKGAYLTGNKIGIWKYYRQGLEPQHFYHDIHAAPITYINYAE